MVLAKVKNHAMVPRGLVLSTGRSDYIYAGTQVLLNTLFFTLYLPPCLPLSVPPLHSPHHFSVSFFPSCPKVQSRYKWLFAVQLPQHVCICSRLSLTACKTKKENGALSLLTNCSSEHKRLLNGDVRVPLEMSVLEEAAQPLYK